MLTIEVNGNALHIAKGTSLQMEVNSGIFSTDGVEGDIMFTFDVPAASNDTVFRHARFVYVQRLKKYACIVKAGGIEIARGDLYIQKATMTTYSCGLVINPWPEGFADKKLKENDYGEAIVISQNATEHNAKWLEFLKSTLNPDSVVKFPLFLDTAFYGSGNNDFGWFLTQYDNAPENASGIQASLNTNDNIGLDRCYINRLFFNSGGDVIEERPGNRGVRVFNNRTADNPNSFAFCPALQLTWLLGKVAANGGYRAEGGFLQDTDTAKIYSQSLRALDGLLTQFDNEAGFSAGITPSVDYYHTMFAGMPHFMQPFTDANGNEQYLFYPKADGTHHFHVVVRTYLPANVVQNGTTEVEENGNTVTRHYEEALVLMMTDRLNNLWKATASSLYGNWDDMDSLFGHWYQPYYVKTFKSHQLSSFGYAGAGFYEITFDFTVNDMSRNQMYMFAFAKCRGMMEEVGGYGQRLVIKDFESVPITADATSYSKVYNCFADKLRYGEHVPDLTNADFIGTLCKTFGLAMFLDSTTKRAEFAFVRDILEKSGFLDLTAYAVDGETAIEKTDERKYVFKLEGVTSDETDSTKTLPAVPTADWLPDAAANYGKVCFVENENRYRKAEREGDSIANWVFRWNPQGGANQTLKAGEGSEESITPSLKIPVMEITDSKSEHPEFVMRIEQAGCSPVFDTGNTDFPMVLETYLGARQLAIPQAGNPFIEVAQPTRHNRSGEPLDGVSLTVQGENSVGERWVRPWLDFLAGYEKVKYRFVLSLSEFLNLWRLLKPQEARAENQVRWLLVAGVKSLPIKITFQFTEGAQSVIAEVEAAKWKISL